MEQNTTSNNAFAAGSSLRVSTEDIDKAIHDLEDAFTEGRLNDRELEDRIEQALHAKTAQDLALALLDLKPQEQAIASMKVRSELPRLKDARAVYSNMEKNGPFILPKTYSVTEIFGSCLLDLSRAKLESPCSTIHISDIYGHVQILVSPGIRVRVEGTAIMGDVVNTVDDEHLQDDAPLIQIYANKIYGDIKIITKR